MVWSSLGRWLKGSWNSILSQGSTNPACAAPPFDAFRAALAFAIVSRREVEDLEAFLISLSSCRSCAVLSDETEDGLETEEDEGELVVDEILDRARVFLTNMVCCEESIIGSDGLLNALLEAGQSSGAFELVFLDPLYTGFIGESVSDRLGGVAVLDDSAPGTELVLGVGFFNLEGLLAEVIDLRSVDV